MPRLDDDTYTRISLIGNAERLFTAKGDRDAAVAELQRIARGRTDLLASAAGRFLGMGTWSSAGCHRLLVDAGAGPEELIQAAAAQTRANLTGTRYGSEGMGGPRASRAEQR